MAEKCAKCGADLSSDAAFCPICGAAKQAQPAAQPAQPAPVAPPPPKPVKTGSGGLEGFIEFIFSTKMLTIAVGICFLIAWIMRIIMQFINRANFTGGNTLAYDALATMNFTFMAGAGLLLFGAGFLYTKYNVYIRTGLIAAGAVILAVSL